MPTFDPIEITDIRIGELLLHLNPRVRQMIWAVASVKSSSHTVPHWLSWNTSSRPLVGESPPARRKGDDPIMYWKDLEEETCYSQLCESLTQVHES